MKLFRIKADFLAHEVFREYLPYLKISNIHEALEIRRKLKDELESFRTEIDKLAVEIESRPWDSGFEKQIIEIIAKKINPAVQQIHNKLATSRNRLIKKVFDSVVSLKTATPLIVTVFGNIPLEFGLAISAGVATFDLVLKTILERKEIRRNNGLSLLFSMKKK